MMTLFPGIFITLLAPNQQSHWSGCAAWLAAALCSHLAVEVPALLCGVWWSRSWWCAGSDKCQLPCGGAVGRGSGGLSPGTERGYGAVSNGIPRPPASPAPSLAASPQGPPQPQGCLTAPLSPEV